MLCKNRNNLAVLPDYLSMEAHQGGTLDVVYRRMAILSEFPDQVVVLKSTRIVCGLSGRASGLQRRLIDANQTLGFRTYVRQLKEAQQGNASYQRQLAKLRMEALQHLNRVLEDARPMGEIFGKIAKEFTKSERAIARDREPFTDRMIKKIARAVLELSVQLLRRHPSVRRLPSRTELPNTFIFRMSLCMYLLALRWAATGGAKDATPRTLRNDLVDMNIATYATFFDGLLSEDEKVIDVHQEARVLLVGLFNCTLPSGVLCAGDSQRRWATSR